MYSMQMAERSIIPHHVSKFEQLRVGVNITQRMLTEYLNSIRNHTHRVLMQY